MSLNTGQKRFLAAVLMELEEHLLKLEQWLQMDKINMVFSQISNPFPPKQRTQLLELIVNIKDQLRTMRDTFALPIETVDLRWLFSVNLLYFETTLEECSPRRLKSFGEMDDEIAEALTHQLDKLIQHLTALRHIVRLVETQSSSQS